MRFNKKGLSPIIATVLIILITVVAAAIILAFVVPFVNDSLSGTKECYDILGEIEFAETGYNCYIDNSTTKLTGFSIRIEGEEIGGFNIILGRDGSAESYRVENGTGTGGIKLRGQSTFGGDLVIPERGGVRTYVANGSYETVEIYPILKTGRVCEMAGSIDLNPCVDVTL